MILRGISRTRSKGGFTWVELLVSIGGLTMVFGLLFTVFSTPKECGPGSRTSAVIKDICNALKSYREDYRSFPQVAPPRGTKEFILVGDPQSGATTGNAGLFDVLRAIDRGVNADHILNKRQQKYIEITKASDPKRPRDGFADGAEFPEAIQGQLLDSWGSQYCVVMGMSGTEGLDLRSIYTDAPIVIRFPVIAFSLSKDRQLGTAGDKSLRKSQSDALSDIISWE